ncbi:hypothetical protein BDK51DRAFT_38228, partial [Blyttiomyces helicus]
QTPALSNTTVAVRTLRDFWNGHGLATPSLSFSGFTEALALPTDDESIAHLILQNPEQFMIDVRDWDTFRLLALRHRDKSRPVSDVFNGDLLHGREEQRASSSTVGSKQVVEDASRYLASDAFAIVLSRRERAWLREGGRRVKAVQKAMQKKLEEREAEWEEKERVWEEDRIALRASAALAAERSRSIINAAAKALSIAIPIPSPVASAVAIYPPRDSFDIPARKVSEAKDVCFERPSLSRSTTYSPGRSFERPSLSYSVSYPRDRTSFSRADRPSLSRAPRVSKQSRSPFGSTTEQKGMNQTMLHANGCKRNYFFDDGGCRMAQSSIEVLRPQLNRKHQLGSRREKANHTSDLAKFLQPSAFLNRLLRRGCLRSMERDTGEVDPIVVMAGEREIHVTRYAFGKTVPEAVPPGPVRILNRKQTEPGDLRIMEAPTTFVAFSTDMEEGMPLRTTERGSGEAPPE